MKKTVILATFAATLMLSAFTSSKNYSPDVAATEATAPAKAVAYNVVNEKSEVRWNGKKVTGEHYGSISLKNGQLLVTNNKPTGGTFVMDMTSITVEDIKDAGSNGRLTGHLKSDDFFSVEKHPTSTFTITSIKPIAKAAAGKPNYTVKGDLTIKGITNPVEFPAVINIKNGEATAQADITVNRTKYDIRYRSSNFFENLGDKAIHDDFTIALNITAKQANL